VEWSLAVQLELRWSEGNLDSLYVSACKSARCSCLPGTKQWKGQKGPSVGDEQKSSMAGRFRAARYACSKFQIGDLCPESPILSLHLCVGLGTIQAYKYKYSLYRYIYICGCHCVWVSGHCDMIYSTLVVGTKHVCSTRQLCWYMQNSSPLCELVVVEWITSGIAFIFIYTSQNSPSTNVIPLGLI
jgi:hypothetical protein